MPESPLNNLRALDMYWKTKAAIFRALKYCPFPQHLLYQLQRHGTHMWPRPPTALDELTAAARRIHAAAAGRADQFLEIGAGRDLTVAIALRLMGVRRITCVDVTRLAKLPLIRHAAKHIASNLGKPAPIFETWHDLEAFGISYVAPASLTDAALPNASFDCFYSVDTLEHIPPSALTDTLIAARALLKPNGLSVHLIDYSDHFARDTDLSRFNFLTYDDKTWLPFNTRFHYVNRLRHSQVVALFNTSGFIITHAEPEVVEAQPAISEHLAPQFRSMDLNDLFTLRSLIVAAPGAAT